ncbi:DMT family transporter [Streptomyces sp. XD-27]|uniref:DMT family transporter n=1 Tax=Streptomyces sp. XD-27 TaxID=3062779 RepID=UPI0026F415B4|nr:DMT family transporter [Streptomyces sp. XD-27]WKX69284.1 DMT family transporter [Streptomyces sp. XD-27]
MLWGVAGALLANVLYSTGFVLEKRALSGLPPLSVTSPARLVRLVLGSPLWIGGALALALGFGAQLVVYRTLPIAAAQGLFVSGLVLLLMLSSAVLGERTSGRERRSIVVILGALVMVVASLRGGGESISHSAPAAVLLAVCAPSLAAGLWLYGAAERRARRRHRLPTSGVAYGVAIGLLYGVSSLAIKGVSGALATHGPGAAPARLALTPYPYLLLITGVGGLVLSQTALQRCRASLIVPVCTTITCVFTVACGTVVFGEPLPDEPLRLALRLGGTALAVIVLLTLPRHSPEPAAAKPDQWNPAVQSIEGSTP